jgi:5-methylcytosine-specific restriction endonuclease McrA
MSHASHDGDFGFFSHLQSLQSLIEKIDMQDRKAVFERDRGICAKCGLDTEDARFRFHIGEPAPLWRQFALWEHEIATERNCTRRLPLNRVTLWDADHIRRWVDGGTDALTNLQTLCFWCHHAKSVGQQSPAARPRFPDPPRLVERIDNESSVPAIEKFFESMCVFGPNEGIPFPALISTFRRFCKVNRLTRWTGSTLRPVLNQRGVQFTSLSGRIGLVGISLRREFRPSEVEES